LKIIKIGKTNNKVVIYDNQTMARTKFLNLPINHTVSSFTTPLPT